MAIIVKEPPPGSPGSQSVTSSGTGTDNMAVRWDGTGTRTVQDSLVNIDDAGRVVIPGAGAASTPGLLISGTPFANTTADSFPQLMMQPSGTPTSLWPLTGTFLGINAPAGSTMDAINIRLGGVLYFRLQYSTGIGEAFSGWRAAAAGLFDWTNRTRMSAPADGHWRLDNNANTAGFLLDGTTDAVMRLRNRGNSADATLQARDLVLSKTLTPGGTTGNQTINNATGTVQFAAAAATLTVTNSLALTTSLIFVTVLTNDSSAVIKNVVRSAGSFLIRLNVAATAETTVGFLVTN